MDHKAAEVDCLRIIDDSGEDYLYAAKRFLVMDLPKDARGKLMKAVKSQSA